VAWHRWLLDVESTATGLQSVAVGVAAQSSGTGSLAIGDNTVASGDASTAVGYLAASEWLTLNCNRSRVLSYWRL